MRKALVLTVLYLFGSEAVAQKSFRHTPTVTLDDLQDNEMFLGNGNKIGSTIYNPGNPFGQGPLINRPIPRNTFDDVEDNEMFKFDRPAGSPPPYRPSTRGGFDDAEDSEMFTLGRPIGSTPPFNPTPFNPSSPFNPKPFPKPAFDDAQDDEMALDLRLPREPTYRIRFAEDDDELFGVPLGNGGSGIYASGGSARGGGVAWGGVGQYSHNIGKNTQLIGGATVSHAPGSKVNIAPHVGVKFSFDDENDDQLFAEDDELFGVPLGNGGSGLYASGGSARGGGVAWGGVGQYSHNIGKNTQLIGGATVSHAPGSKVNIAPHVGVKFSFDDEN